MPGGFSVVLLVSKVPYLGVGFFFLFSFLFLSNLPHFFDLLLPRCFLFFFCFFFVLKRGIYANYI